MIASQFKSKIIVLLSALLLMSNAFAFINDSLYESRLHSKSSSKSDRDALLREGLTQVLTKLSGSAKVVEHETIQQALKDPSQYVQKYAYEGDTFHATFSPAFIKKLLSEAQLPLWDERPLLVVWLAMDTGDERHLVGADSEPGIVALLNTLSQDRGLPLVVPMLDLQDITSISVTDVWGAFPSVLKQASLRYGADAILVGRLSQKADQWESDWKLVSGLETFEWQAKGTRIHEAIEEAITGVMDRLAGSYEGAPQTAADHQGPFELTVEHVAHVGDYSEVMKYLNRLHLVESVDVLALDNKGVKFNITPKKGVAQEDIMNLLVTESRLKPNLAFHDQNTYEWIERE